MDSLHKIGDGDPILGAGVPDTRRQACFGRRLHAGELTRHVAGTRVDAQQVRRSSYDDAKGPVGAGALGQVANVFEFGDTESFLQAESDGRALFLGDHKPPPVVQQAQDWIP